MSEKEIRIPTSQTDPEIQRAIELKNYELIKQRIKDWEALLEKTTYNVQQLEGFKQICGELDDQLQLELDSDKAGSRLIVEILASLDQVEADLQVRIDELSPSLN